MSDCIIWQGEVNAAGYGRVWSTQLKRKVMAHRQAWLDAGRALTPGLCLHHTCGVTLCVNVEHLVEVSYSENIRLGIDGVPGMCKSGQHLWVPENIYTKPDGRDTCRPCRLQASRRFKERQRERTV